jgi:hypothetical protein
LSGTFLVLWPCFPPPIKLTEDISEILLKMALNKLNTIDQLQQSLIFLITNLFVQVPAALRVDYVHGLMFNNWMILIGFKELVQLSQVELVPLLTTLLGTAKVIILTLM